VFAAALRSSPRFQVALLAELGLGVDSFVALQIRQEARTGADLDRIDLELRAMSPTGGLRRRVWIEAKVNARLAAAVHGDDGEVTREVQLVRYRHALDARDQERPDLPPSLLVLLIPGRPRPEEQRQAAAATAAILRWERIATLAAQTAIAIAGSDWRLLGREPQATVELANLELMLWFLTEATRSTPSNRKEPFVGLDPIEPPFTPDLLSAWRLTIPAIRAAEGLSAAAGDLLVERGWRSEELDPPEGDDVDGGDKEEHDAADLEDFQVKSLLTPPDDAWWTAVGEGCLWLRPYEVGLISPSDEPVIQVGIEFQGEDGPVPSPEWLDQLEQTRGLLRGVRRCAQPRFDLRPASACVGLRGDPRLRAG
jgi:hypothetical protein